MELNVQLSHPVLVLPSQRQLYKQQANDAPPAYDMAYIESDSGSFASPSSSTSWLLGSLSSSTSASSSSPSFSSSSQTLTAYITLKVPTGLTAKQTLTSLTAKLIASESLAYSNGGFEQSWPVDIDVSVPLPEPVDLEPGQTYSFQASIPCPSDMPPSVQLPSARLRYKVRVKAKVQPTSSKSSSFLAHLLQGKTLHHQTDLLVVQAAEVESDLFSHIKYVPIQGLGSTCISMTPLSCVVGESTLLCLTLPDSEAKSKITKVEMALVQDSHFDSRQRASAISSKQYKPRRFFQLEPLPAPSTPIAHTLSEKGTISNLNSSVVEPRFLIPNQEDVQPSTLAGTNSAIRVSHHLQLTIHYNDPAAPDAEQSRTYTCAWPVTVAHSEAVSHRIADQLPAYTRANCPLTKSCTPQPTSGTAVA